MRFLHCLTRRGSCCSSQGSCWSTGSKWATWWSCLARPISPRPPNTAWWRHSGEWAWSQDRRNSRVFCVSLSGHGHKIGVLYIVSFSDIAWVTASMFSSGGRPSSRGACLILSMYIREATLVVWFVCSWTWGYWWFVSWRHSADIVISGGHAVMHYICGMHHRICITTYYVVCITTPACVVCIHTYTYIHVTVAGMCMHAYTCMYVLAGWLSPSRTTQKAATKWRSFSQTLP